MFTWADGTLVHPDRYTEWFAKERERLGLPRIRLHDVRHTYASVGLRNATGWHEIKVISQRLGHSSVGFTLDTYAHVLPSADVETAHTLARHILGDGGVLTGRLLPHRPARDIERLAEAVVRSAPPSEVPRA